MPIPPAKAWWALWLALLSGTVVIPLIIGSQPGFAEKKDTLPWWQLALIPFVIGSVLRWNIIPRLTTPQAGFIAFIIGMAMCEMVALLGSLVFPSHRILLATIGGLGVAQFAPVFAKRFAP